MTLKLWASGLAMVLSMPAAAQEPPPPPPLLRAVSGCLAIVEADTRLACFDKTVMQLDTAVTSHQVTVLDGESVQHIKRSLFGFSLPRVGLFAVQGKDDGDRVEFQQIDTTIKRVIPTTFGMYQFVLADGARWATTDTMSHAPQEGAGIRIRQGTLGAYFLNIANRRSVRGRRIG